MTTSPASPRLEPPPDPPADPPSDLPADPPVDRPSGTPERQPGPSLRPAAIVLGLAVLIVVLGGVVALLGSSSAHAPSPQAGIAVPGVPFTAVPAATVLAHIESNQEPPLDILHALTVPAVARFEGSSDADADVDQFDRSVTLAVPATTTSVALFYRKELPAGHWSMQFDGRAGHSLELIAQRNGSDGYQWRVAVVITTVNPALTPALAGYSQTSASTLVLTLYQVGDAS